MQYLSWYKKVFMKPDAHVIVQDCFDRFMPTALITQELHRIDTIEAQIPLSTVYLHNLLSNHQYNIIASYVPTTNAEAYITGYAKSKLNIPLKQVLNYIKDEMIQRDCDYLRLLYANIAKDINVLIDLKHSPVTYTWEYWHVFSELLNDLNDLNPLIKHVFYPIGFSYTLVHRHIKSSNDNHIETVLLSLQAYNTDFPNILFFILQLQHGKNPSQYLENEPISSNIYMPDYAHIIANELSKQDDLESVQSMTMQLSLEDPINSNTKVVQAIYYSLKNMNLKSIELLTSAVNNKPSALSYLLLGHEYFQFGNYKKAVNLYLRVIQLNKKDVRGWAATGDVYFSMGLFEQAIRYYSECSTINQKDAYIYTQLGNCYEKLDNPQMWYKSTLAAWEIESTSETSLALYKAAKSYGLEATRVFEILKNAYCQHPNTLEFLLLVELIEYAIESNEIVFAKQVYRVAKEQSGWMHQSKLTEISAKLAMRQPVIAVENSPIRNEELEEYSDNQNSSACEETPTRNRPVFGYYELGR